MFHSETRDNLFNTSHILEKYHEFDDNAITVQYPDGQSKQFIQPCFVRDVLQDILPTDNTFPIVGAMINHEICGLQETIDVNVLHIEPIFLNTPIGASIYRRTLCFVLTVAFSHIFPTRQVVIGHSLGNGYYYRVKGSDDNPLTERDVMRISEEMTTLATRGIPIKLRSIAWEEALNHFLSTKEEQTVMLISQHNQAKIPIVACDGYIDMAHGPHLENTRLLTCFEVRAHGNDNGFLLRFPHSTAPALMPPFVDMPNIFETFQESKERGQVMGIECVGDLNRIVRKSLEGDLTKYILVSESMHDKALVHIASSILTKTTTQLVLIAGPSSSGKTTFARKLCIQLQVLGKIPVVISMDDFFVNREDTPKDENGDYDFETVEAIDIALLNEKLTKLLAGEVVTLPHFNFVTGKREWGKTIQLNRDEILVMEGIHGLNDRLTNQVSDQLKFRIFVSALTQLNLDAHNRIATTDNRLIRRMVRDYRFRGTSGEQTLLRWPSVRKGEEKHIFPFQGNADIVFNSALDYEMAALKGVAEPLLRNITPTSSVYHEAQRMLAFITNFDPIPLSNIPQNSILREFVGESPYHYKWWDK